MALVVKVTEARESSKFEDGAIREAIHRHIIKELLKTILDSDDFHDTLTLCKVNKPEFINTKRLEEVYLRELCRWHKMSLKFIKKI